MPNYLLIVSRRAQNLKELQRKDEDGAAGNLSTSTAIAVTKLRGNVKLPLAALLHELHGLGPSLDHLVRGEGQGLSALVAAVELGAVNERAGIVARTRGADLGRLAGPRRDLLVAQTRLQLHDAVLLILLGQEGKTLGAGAGKDRRGQEQNSNKDGEQ